MRNLTIIFVICTADTISSIEKKKPKPTTKKTQTGKTPPVFLIPTCACLDINFKTNRNNLSSLTPFLHHCQLYQHVGCPKFGE